MNTRRFLCVSSVSFKLVLLTTALVAYRHPWPGKGVSWRVLFVTVWVACRPPCPGKGVWRAQRSKGPQADLPRHDPPPEDHICQAQPRSAPVPHMDPLMMLGFPLFCHADRDISPPRLFGAPPPEEIYIYICIYIYIYRCRVCNNLTLFSDTLPSQGIACELCVGKCHAPVPS